MITEDEAFWAGIAVAVMMLGGGFSMLFLRALTGEGAVVLALGLMTMVLTIQMRAKPVRRIETWTPMESRVLTPTPPVQPSKETTEAQTMPVPEPEPQPTEAKTEQTPQSAEPVQPAEQAEPVPVEQTPQAEQPPVEPPQTPQPQQPQAPIEEKTEPPKEEPQIVPPAAN